MKPAEQRALMIDAENAAGSLPRLAADLGVRPSTVYRWINGTRKMHGLAVRTVRQYIAERTAKDA